MNETMNKPLTPSESKLLRDQAKLTAADVAEWARSNPGGDARAYLVQKIIEAGGTVPGGYEPYAEGVSTGIIEQVDSIDEIATVWLDPKQDFQDLVLIETIAREVFAKDEKADVTEFVKFALMNEKGFAAFVNDEMNFVDNEFKQAEQMVVKRAVLEAKRKERLERGEKADLGIPIPAATPGFYIPPRVLTMFDAMETALAMNGRCPKVMFIGLPGCGKTSVCMEFAAKLQKPCLILDMQIFRDAKEMFGYMSLANGEHGSITKWHDSIFVQALREGDCVIDFDEVSRAQPGVLNALLPLLDGRGKIFIEEIGGYVEVGEGIVFMATANGATAQDKDIRQIPAAFGERFSTVIECGFAPEAEEKKIIRTRFPGVSKAFADKLVIFAQEQRRQADSRQFDRHASTRTILDVAMWMELLGDADKAFEIGLQDKFSSDKGLSGGVSQRQQLKATWQGIFGGLA